MNRSSHTFSLKKDYTSGDLAFRKLFEDELKEMHWSESAIAQVLPKMIKRSTSELLVTYFYEQLFFIKEQIHRSEHIFRLLGCFPQSKKSVAMEGILKEASESMKEIVAKVRDTGIMSAAQKIIHYEIAAYGSLHVVAGELGFTQVRLILMQTLFEKRNSENKLLKINTSQFDKNNTSQNTSSLEFVD